MVHVALSPDLQTLALSNTPILPAWVVIPLAGAVMLVISAHVLTLPKAQMPESRRRIRITNGLVMLMVTALLAYAFGIATTAQSKTFVVVWSSVVFLLSIVVGLALLDVLNTLRLGAHARRDLRRELARPSGVGPRDEVGKRHA